MITSATARPRCSPPSTSLTEPSSAAVCRPTPIRNSSSFSMPSSAPSQPERSSTPSPTTMPPTNIPRSFNGSPTIPVGPSISPQPPLPGSTPSKASSPSSPAGASDAASSPPSPISRTPSAAISMNITDHPSHSSGPNPPKQSSKNSKDCLYL